MLCVEGLAFGVVRHHSDVLSFVRTGEETPDVFGRVLKKSFSSTWTCILPPNHVPRFAMRQETEDGGIDQYTDGFTAKYPPSMLTTCPFVYCPP
jgi:hypothetical protein